MLTREQNDLLTRTGPGTPGGQLLRKFWQPAALVEELPAGGAPVPIRLLGEDLVMFRDETGQVGLLGIHCSHRGADLSYGRLEDGGLRCIYHGWLYDVHGTCLEQPGEPTGSTFYQKIQHPAYPCAERGGIIFGYLGGGTPPELPNYEFLLAPAERRSATKGYHECNYLQANEGNIDPVHLSFLHRIFRGEEAGAPSRAAAQSYFGVDTSPALEIETTDFGVRIFTARHISADLVYLRISNFIFPNLSAFPGGNRGGGYGVNWHVPIDDEHHWKFAINFSRTDQGVDLFQRDPNEMGADYHLVREKSNRYLQDREQQRTRSYLGIGSYFMAHDKLAVEGPGPIQDREAEHLGTTDKVIVAARLELLKAIQDVQQGRDPMHLVRTPEQNAFPFLGAYEQVIPASMDWRKDWREVFPQSQRAQAEVVA